MRRGAFLLRWRPQLPRTLFHTFHDTLLTYDIAQPTRKAKKKIKNDGIRVLFQAEIGFLTKQDQFSPDEITATSLAARMYVETNTSTFSVSSTALDAAGHIRVDLRVFRQ